VVVVPNSGCERIVNHTKLRSGAEVTLLLDRERADLARALAAIEQERQAFASDPAWQPLLLETPLLRGIRAARPEGLEMSVLLVTVVGRQGEAQRELLRRLVLRLQREGIPLGGRE
jgi:small conductance mechanosensitive channel